MRFSRQLQNRGVKHGQIADNAVHQRNIDAGAVSIHHLDLEALGSVTVSVPWAVVSTPPQVTYRIENFGYTDVPFESSAAATVAVGWEAALVVDIQTGAAVTEAARLTLRRIPFSSIPDGSFVSPGGHGDTSIIGHPPPPAHGRPTALRPMVQIEDGVDNAGVPQKRFTVFHQRASLYNGVEALPSPQSGDTTGAPADMGTMSTYNNTVELR